jgi:hypothetical protein
MQQKVLEEACAITEDNIGGFTPRVVAGRSSYRSFSNAVRPGFCSALYAEPNARDAVIFSSEGLSGNVTCGSTPEVLPCRDSHSL